MIQNLLAKLIPNFTLIAKSSNPRTSLKGVLPTFSALFTLLLLSSGITLGMLLWTKTMATIAAFIPAFALTFVSIAGLALLNFIFMREVTTAVLNAREVRKRSVVDKHNPTYIRKMVKHILFELNAYYKEKYGEAHVDLPLPRICTYTSSEVKVQATLGTTPENAALFISTTFTDSRLTDWDQRHLASLIALKLDQAYHARGWSKTFVSIGNNFLSTLESFKDSENLFYKGLGYLMGPMRYGFLVFKAVERSHILEAVTNLFAVGRGIDYYEAIDKKVNPTLYKQGSYSYLAWDSQKKKRPPYNGPFREFIKPITDRIDGLVWTEDRHDKKAFRLVSFIYAAVREGLYSLQELTESDPRTTRVKDHLREKLGIGNVVAEFPKKDDKKWADITVASYFDYLANEKQLIAPLSAKDEQEFIQHLTSKKIANYAEFMNKFISNLTDSELDCLIFRVGEQEMKYIDQLSRQKNKRYFKEIPVEMRYQPIGPESNGTNPSEYPLAKQVQAQAEQIARLVAQVAESERQAAAERERQAEQIARLEAQAAERERQAAERESQAEESALVLNEQILSLQRQINEKDRHKNKQLKRLQTQASEAAECQKEQLVSLLESREALRTNSSRAMPLEQMLPQQQARGEHGQFKIFEPGKSANTGLRLHSAGVGSMPSVKAVPTRAVTSQKHVYSSEKGKYENAAPPGDMKFFSEWGHAQATGRMMAGSVDTGSVIMGGAATETLTTGSAATGDLAIGDLPSGSATKSSSCPESVNLSPAVILSPISPSPTPISTLIPIQSSKSPSYAAPAAGGNGYEEGRRHSCSDLSNIKDNPNARDCIPAPFMEKKKP